MLGKIKNIEEVFDLNAGISSLEDEKEYVGIEKTLSRLFISSMDGYKVETEEHTYYVLIEGEQCCCENWGYFSSEDDFNKFIGAELLEVNLVNTALNVKILEDKWLDADEIQFVNFVTDKGVLQLAVYNSHNGYYGHEIVIVKDDDIILDSVL